MFLIYNTTNTMIVSETASRSYYKTMSSAKAARTRIINKGIVVGDTVDLAIAETQLFYNTIEKTETVINLMTGKEVVQPVNTPHCCDVSSELYWSM